MVSRVNDPAVDIERLMGAMTIDPAFMALSADDRAGKLGEIVIGSLMETSLVEFSSRVLVAAALIPFIDEDVAKEMDDVIVAMKALSMRLKKKHCPELLEEDEPK